jgi:hypothetical protein
MASRQGTKAVTDTVHTESDGAVSTASQKSVAPATLSVEPLDGKLLYTVHTEFTVNPGNYESKKLGGHLQGVFSSDLDAAEVGAYLHEQLFRCLAEEIADAQVIARTNKLSIIHLFNQ